MNRSAKQDVHEWMLRSLFLALLVLSLPACLTVRGAVGPVMTPQGQGGMDAAVAVGAGGGAGENRAWFVSSKIGFALSPVQKEPGLVVQANVDYVSEEGAAERDKGIAWRVGGRLGARPVFGEESEGEAVAYSTIGVAAAVFPLSWAGDRHSQSSDDKFGDLFGLGRLRGFYNLGLELGVERMFGQDTADAWLFSLAVVFDMSTIPD